MTATARRPWPMPWKMGLGFGLGLLFGLVVHMTVGADAGWVQAFTQWVTTPASRLFLNLIFMLIVPLLFSALVMGIAEMGDIRALGRIGWKTLA
jgi:DAACS family dicarboxylate/amino acid:cation (Na+ or H+) symporter